MVAASTIQPTPMWSRMRMWASASLRLRSAAWATAVEAFSFTIKKVKDTPAKYAPATHRIRPAFTREVWHGAGERRNRALRSAERAMNGSVAEERRAHEPGPGVGADHRRCLHDV